MSFDVAPFSESTVDLNIQHMEEGEEDDEELTIRTFTAIVPHVSRVKHAASAFAATVANRVASVGNGDQLWKDRDSLFANLDFCEGVGEAIEALSANDPHFVPVRKALKALDELARDWLGAQFPWRSSLTRSRRKAI